MLFFSFIVVIGNYESFFNTYMQSLTLVEKLIGHVFPMFKVACFCSFAYLLSFSFLLIHLFASVFSFVLSLGSVIQLSLLCFFTLLLGFVIHFRKSKVLDLYFLNCSLSFFHKFFLPRLMFYVHIICYLSREFTFLLLCYLLFCGRVCYYECLSTLFFSTSFVFLVRSF